MVHYRIVTDRFAGFEVQSWRWWWPIWMQCWELGPTNTHGSIEEAEKFARGKAGIPRRVVKYIEPSPPAETEPRKGTIAECSSCGVAMPIERGGVKSGG